MTQVCSSSKFRGLMSNGVTRASLMETGRVPLERERFTRFDYRFIIFRDRSLHDRTNISFTTFLSFCFALPSIQSPLQAEGNL